MEKNYKELENYERENIFSTDFYRDGVSFALGRQIERVTPYVDTLIHGVGTNSAEFTPSAFTGIIDLIASLPATGIDFIISYAQPNGVIGSYRLTEIGVFHKRIYVSAVRNVVPGDDNMYATFTGFLIPIK